VPAKYFEERASMLRVVNAEALARRFGETPRAGEAPESMLRRLLPPERLVFWPADRF